MTAVPPAVAAGTLVIERLLAAGVTTLVLSPGSRSAPLALAAAAAERGGVLDLLVRVDERSAGFTALGLAKVTGTPVAVVCTSGTAVANLVPAVVEARYSGVPLVVVTADRPPEVRARGASQTIDQVGLFDAFVLGSRDLPVPEEGTHWPVEWSEHVDAGVALAARGRVPVHLNAPFRQPLVGHPPSAWEAGTPAELPGVMRVDAGEMPARGVIVAGDLDLWADDARAAIEELAVARGWPIVAEASSGMAGAATSIPHGTLLLADAAARERLRADLVVTVGPFGLDRGVLQFVGEAERHLAVRLRPRTPPPDPLRTAERVLDGIPVCGPGAVHDQGGVDDGWLPAWRAATAEFRSRLDHSLGEAGPTVASVAREVWRSLGPDALLLTASSLAIRALGAVASGPGPRVMANRGANGIDGLVSTALGAAHAWQRRPRWLPGGGAAGSGRRRTVALLGDLAFLHDHNGLFAAQVEEAPDLTIVVADNDGGGIFRTLEQGADEFAADYDRVFGTPHGRDLVAVATAAGLPAERVAVSQLADALRKPEPGMRVLVVPVADSSVERRLSASLGSR